MRELLESLAWHFSLLSLVAVGGANALLPQLQADAVTHAHWLTIHEFTELVAVAQVAPGPNLLIVPLIGWHVAGWLGAGVALIAFVFPTACVTAVVGRALARHAEQRVIGALRSALPPVAAGLLIASGIALGEANGGGYAAIVIAAVVALAATFFERNPLWFMAGAACAGLVLLR